MWRILMSVRFSISDLNVRLVEAVAILREEPVLNLSLQMKLQEEFSKPACGGILEDAGDLDRIERLKAPEGLLGSTFFELMH